MLKKSVSILVIFICLYVNIMQSYNHDRQNNKAGVNKDFIKLGSGKTTESLQKKDSNVKLLSRGEFDRKSQKMVQKPSDEDLYWLARIINSEAPDDSDEGQLAVANVVLNRLNQNWERSIKRVIFQKINGTFQFTPVENKTIYKEPTNGAIKNAIDALNGRKVLPESIMYFYMPLKCNRNDWIRTRKIYKEIGCHRFCY